MIKINAEVKFNCPFEKVVSSLKGLDKIYSLYSPKEHVKCEYVKGSPFEQDSILLFQEYIAGKKYQMKYRIYKVINEPESKEITLKAMFPRSILNIRAVLNLKVSENGAKLSRTIMMGSEKPVIGAVIDALFYLFIGKKYYRGMVEHNDSDLNELKMYIENKC